MDIINFKSIYVKLTSNTVLSKISLNSIEVVNCNSELRIKELNLIFGWIEKRFSKKIEDKIWIHPCLIVFV